MAMLRTWHVRAMWYTRRSRDPFSVNPHELGLRVRTRLTPWQPIVNGIQSPLPTARQFLTYRREGFC